MFKTKKQLSKIYKELLQSNNVKDRNLQKRMDEEPEQEVYWRGNPHGQQAY